MQLLVVELGVNLAVEAAEAATTVDLLLKQKVMELPEVVEVLDI